MKKLLFIIVFSVIFSGLGFAANEYHVYTWGYGDIMQQTLIAISNVMGYGEYRFVVRMVILISTLTAVLSLTFGKDFSIWTVGQKIAVVILVYGFIYSTPYKVIIYEQNGNEILEADRVPAVIGPPLSIFSQLEYALSKSFKKGFEVTPSGQFASGIGGGASLISGFDLLYSASSYRVHDPKLNQTVSAFIANCVFPDVLSGYLDLATVGASNNFWGSLNDTHPARISGIYRPNEISGIDGDLQPCPDVYTYINNQFTLYTDPSGTGFQQLANATGLMSGSAVYSMLGTISKQTFDYQQGGQAFLTNAIAMNAFNDAYIQTAAQVGIDPSALAYGAAKAGETSKMQMTLNGVMAKKYMPIAKGYLTVIFIAVIPLIFLIGIATNSLAKPLGMVVGILTAVSLWTIGSQLLDFFILVRTQGLMDVGGTFSLTTKPIVESGAVDSVSMVMSMYWMIPTLSFAIASMSGYSASSMMSGIGSVTTSSAGSAAGEAVTGSASIGVIRQNMVSANKFDGVSAMSGGYNNKLSYANDIHGSADTKVSSDLTTSDMSKSLSTFNTPVNAGGYILNSGTSERLENGMTKYSGVGSNGLSTSVITDKNGNAVDYKANGIENGMNVSINNNVKNTEGVAQGHGYKSVAIKDGADDWRTTSETMLIGDKGWKQGGVSFEKGSEVTRQMDGTAVAKGVFSYGGERFEGSAVYDRNGELTRLDGKDGKNLLSHDNRQFESKQTAHTEKSQSFTGAVRFADKQGEHSGSGELKHVGDMLAFNGEVGGKKVSMMITGSNLDIANGTAVISGGQAVSIDKTSGISETRNLNTHTVRGGSSVEGFNASQAILASGLSSHIIDRQNNLINDRAESFVNNHDNYMSSFSKNVGSNNLTESQTAQVLGSFEGSAGFELFGTGGKVGVRAMLQADVNNNSGVMTSASLWKAGANAIINNLESERATGVYNNSDGSFNSQRYDSVAQERFEKFDMLAKEGLTKVYGPGAAADKALNTAKGVMNSAGELIDKAAKVLPENTTVQYGKNPNGDIVSKTSKHDFLKRPVGDK